MESLQRGKKKKREKKRENIARKCSRWASNMEVLHLYANKQTNQKMSTFAYQCNDALNEKMGLVLLANSMEWGGKIGRKET